jgi:hypothetical protein
MFINVLKNNCCQWYSSMHNTRRPFYFVFWIPLSHTQVTVYCNAAKSWILTNSVEQNPSRGKANSSSDSQEIPCITVFTTAQYSSPSKARPVWSMHSQHISYRSTLVSASDPHMSLPSGLYPSCFPIKSWYAFLLPPCHLILLDLITLIIINEQY